MTVTVMAAMLPELSACSTSCMITPGEAVVSVSTIIQVTLAGTVAWGVVSGGPGSAVACEVGVRAELGSSCSSVGDSGGVGAPVGSVAVSAEL